MSKRDEKAQAKEFAGVMCPVRTSSEIVPAPASVLKPAAGPTLALQEFRVPCRTDCAWYRGDGSAPACAVVDIADQLALGAARSAQVRAEFLERLGGQVEQQAGDAA